MFILLVSHKKVFSFQKLIIYLLKYSCLSWRTKEWRNQGTFCCVRMCWYFLQHFFILYVFASSYTCLFSYSQELYISCADRWGLDIKQDLLSFVSSGIQE